MARTPACAAAGRDVGRRLPRRRQRRQAGVLLADLAARGVRRLMVEGGSVLAQFLAEGLADELHLAIAIFVGDQAAPRMLGNWPPGARRRMHLAEARPVGDVVPPRYLPRARQTLH